MNGKASLASPSLMRKIIVAYPDVRRKFLFDGEEPVLEEHFDETPGTPAVTPGTPAQHVYTVDTNRLLESLKHQQDLTANAQRQTDKAQEQIDRMIAIIEQLTNMQR